MLGRTNDQAHLPRLPNGVYLLERAFLSPCKWMYRTVVKRYRTNVGCFRRSYAAIS